MNTVLYSPESKELRFGDIKHKDIKSGKTVNIKDALEADDKAFFGKDAFILEALYILGEDTWTVKDTGFTTKDDNELPLFEITNISGALEILRNR